VPVERQTGFGAQSGCAAGLRWDEAATADGFVVAVDIGFADFKSLIERTDTRSIKDLVLEPDIPSNKISFYPHLCFATLEILKPLKRAFEDEIREYQSCASKFINVTNGK
jgi:hypothetical protein